jgi:hypothetical protein
MRFAWLQENSALNGSENESFFDRLILVIYNVVWWVPVVPPLLGWMDYETGFWGFTIVTFVRLAFNLYRNNILPPEQGVNFPFRSP